MAEKQDFQLTSEEAERLKKALRDEEFRKLLAEYAGEIQDPENKKRYEEEITEMERRRGVDVKFVNPQPGFVFKAKMFADSKKKVFVNICHSDAVEKATSSHSVDGLKRGQRWKIPYSLSKPREDLDKANNKCTVYDAVFHPETYKKGQDNQRFKQLLVDTAMDGIEKERKTKLDRKGIKYLRIPYKGMSAPAVIRKRTDRPSETSPDDFPLNFPYPPLQEELEAKKPTKKEPRKATKGDTKAQKKPKKERVRNEPKYTVTHRGEFNLQDYTNSRESTRIKRPKELVVSVVLPGVESASSVELDIYEKRLLLQCAKPDYKLDLALPFPVDEEKGRARFDKSKHSLTITLPVLPGKPPTVEPLVTEVAPKLTNQDEEPESHDSNKLTNPKESCDSSELTNPEESCDSSELTNQIKASDDAIVNDTITENEGLKLEATPTQPTNQISGHVSQQWPSSSSGAWQCPPFNYRQDDESVSFVLLTANVKENSLVSYFDQHYFQLTYRAMIGGVGQAYSFYVMFPTDCSLDPKESKVDVSKENVVVVVKKESAGLWRELKVGCSDTQTSKKQFLTVANVQTALKETVNSDPWAHTGLSSEAEVKVVSVSEDTLEVELCEPDGSREGEQRGAMDPEPQTTEILADPRGQVAEQDEGIQDEASAIANAENSQDQIKNEQNVATSKENTLTDAATSRENTRGQTTDAATSREHTGGQTTDAATSKEHTGGQTTDAAKSKEHTQGQTTDAATSKENTRGQTTDAATSKENTRGQTTDAATTDLLDAATSREEGKTGETTDQDTEHDTGVSKEEPLEIESSLGEQVGQEQASATGQPPTGTDEGSLESPGKQEDLGPVNKPGDVNIAAHADSNPSPKGAVNGELSDRASSGRLVVEKEDGSIFVRVGDHYQPDPTAGEGHAMSNGLPLEKQNGVQFTNDLMFELD